jgi:mannose-6-phosphate isomerase-like protein (cupin superfamily)
VNATDTKQGDVPWGVLGDVSIAAGRIGPGVISSIHFHPVVTQVTYVISGQLGIRMKDASTAEPYDLQMQPGMASICEPGTLFQLRNITHNMAEVLYIVTPSYVFEMVDGQVVYNDAVLVAETWEELGPTHHGLILRSADKSEVLSRRAESMLRLKTAKNHEPAAG